MLVFRFHSLTLIACLGLLTACSSGAGKTEDLTMQPPAQARREGSLLAASGLNVVPSSLQFGEQRVGTTSAAQVVTLRNTGTETLFVSDGTTTGPFAVSPAGPFTMEPGATHELSVTFSPTTRGGVDGTLTFSSNDPFTPRVTVFLSGQGVTPVEVSPVSLDFGAQRVGTTSPPLRVTIRNNGSGNLAVTNVSTSSAPFAASPTHPFTVAPGASQEVSVTFRPATEGAASGTLTLTTDDPDSPSVSISLAGQGVKPAIAVSTTSLDFGEQRVGTTSPVQRVTVRNTGSGNLVVTNVSTTSGPFAAASPTLPFIVAPGASQELSVTFSPTTEGAFSGTLTVSSDDADKPSVSISLAGTAVNPALEVSPARLVFGASNVGVSAAHQEVRFHNPGGTAVTLSSVSFSGTAALDFSAAPPAVFPVKVSPGGTVSLALRFTPGAVGSREAQATFALEGTAQGPAVVELVGEGTSPLVAVSPGRLDFGTWRRGEAVTPLALRLQNTGTGPLTLSRVTLSGADAARFSLAPVSLPLTLAPDAFVDLTVTLNPDAVRTFSATLAVESDDASHPRVEVPLSGKAVGSSLSIEPSSWDFEEVEVGSRSEPRTFTVTNVSSSPRTVDRVEAASAAFEVEAGRLLATPIAPGASATFQVFFHPESAGPASGEVRLTLREESTPDAVLAVSGTGGSKATPATGCSCDSGGGTSAAAGLALLALLALSGRRARAASSSGQR
jgi:HYDIN/CFA65/VesB family protein/ASPM-SPD-2-Hydin domain-containing protein